jgi:hypothetical protein
VSVVSERRKLSSGGHNVIKVAIVELPPLSHLRTAVALPLTAPLATARPPARTAANRVR